MKEENKLNFKEGDIIVKLSLIENRLSCKSLLIFQVGKVFSLMLRNNELYFHSIILAFQIKEEEGFDEKLIEIEETGRRSNHYIGKLNKISDFFWENLPKEMKKKYKEFDHFIFKSNQNDIFYKIAEDFDKDEKSIADYNYCFLGDLYDDVIDFLYKDNDEK